MKPIVIDALATLRRALEDPQQREALTLYDLLTPVKKLHKHLTSLRNLPLPSPDHDYSRLLISLSKYVL